MVATRKQDDRAKAASLEQAFEVIGFTTDEHHNLVDQNGNPVPTDENGKPKILEAMIASGAFDKASFPSVANVNGKRPAKPTLVEAKILEALIGSGAFPKDTRPADANVNGKRTADDAGLPTGVANLARIPTPVEAEMEEQMAYMNKRAKKTKGSGSGDYMSKLIHTTIKNKTMRKIKFAHGSNKERHALEVLKDANLGAKFTGDSPESVAYRERWVTAYMGVCTSKLNGLRSYAQGQVSKACFKWMDAHNGKLPPLERLEAIIQRTLDPTIDEDLALMKWWVEDVLPMAAGNQYDWSDEKKYYMTVSNGAPPDAPKQKYVPPSTEAIAVAFIENCRVRWEKVWELKRANTFPGRTKFLANTTLDFKEVTDKDGNTTKTNELAYDVRAHPKKRDTVQLNSPAYQGKYTRTDIGQCSDSGWSKAGRKAFMRWMHHNKQARLTQNSVDLEEAVLKLMREGKGIVAQSAAEEKLRKRREKYKEGQESEEESDVEIEFDE
jgi:hypothetical protein